MDYMYQSGGGVLLSNGHSGSSKISWMLTNECSMDNNGDIFAWNGLKIDEEEESSPTKGVADSRKRRLSTTASESGDIIRKVKSMESPLIGNDKITGAKKGGSQKGGSKMPHWQVEDYGDLQSDIESSLSLGTDLVSNSYHVSDTILSINGMTVFKQEAPSPNSTDVASLQVSRQHRQSPTSTQHGNNPMVNSTMDDNNSQNMFNSSINQLLSPTALASLHNVIDSNNLSSPGSQDSYTVSSTNYSLIEDCRFQYVLAAATSIATKQNEDTLTYLNQGQSYEVKLKKLGDLSLYRGKVLKSVIRICFYERRLQYMEKEQMLSWQKARPGDRILEADVPLSYGAFDIIQPTNAINLVHFKWDPTKEVGIYIKVNCISTEFTPKKHGGEKGVPFRIQVETYQYHEGVPCSETNSSGHGKRLHAAACQVKVFKLKGADRKHKQDREKIMKRSPTEQEKFQPSYECTVLNDLPNDAVLTASPAPPLNTESSVESSTQPPNNQILPRIENVIRNIATETTPNFLPERKDIVATNEAVDKNYQLSQRSTPQENIEWLSLNRFEKFIETFERFSGDDMLRMSRDDFIQICGNADGIRLHNAIHLKSIAPKLKIYVCRKNSSVYNAVFLSSHNNNELLQKLSVIMGVPKDQVLDIYMEGPHSIHVQLNDDLLSHIKEETMFSLQMIPERNGYVFLLERAIT